MVIDIVPRLEYRIYFHTPRDYFLIVPKFEQIFQQRFELCNDFKGQYLLCYKYEKLTDNPKWLDFCKTQLVDIKDYILEGTDFTYFTDETKTSLIYGYHTQNLYEWQPITHQETTWFDIFSNDYSRLKQNQLPEESVLQILDDSELSNLPDFIEMQGRPETIFYSDWEISGWYYNNVRM